MAWGVGGDALGVTHLALGGVFAGQSLATAQAHVFRRGLLPIHGPDTRIVEGRNQVAEPGIVRGNGILRQAHQDFVGGQ